MKSNTSTYKNYYFIFALILLVIFLSTCSSKEDSTTESTTSDLTWPKAKGCDYSVSDLKTSNFSVLGLAFVQTHVIDSDGCRWQVENNSGNGKQDYELHLVGYRDALVLVEFDGSINSPKTICYDAQENKLVELLLELPDKLPGSDHGINDKFHENIWSGTLPKECFIPGSQISFKDGSSETSKLPLKVGAPTPFKMINLPFYLFGANEQTLDKTQSGNPSLSHALTKNMKDTVSCEFREKLPIAEWQSITHPIKKFVSDYIIVSPRNNQGPKRITNSDEQGDGYAVMSAVLDTLSAIRDASGELIMSTQFYAPIMMLNGNGEYIHPGGGLGGSHRGTGDYWYKGIFFHEQGHAFGIPHVGEQGLKYPYPAGSLKGSAWGYDAVKNNFLVHLFQIMHQVLQTVLIGDSYLMRGNVLKMILCGRVQVIRILMINLQCLVILMQPKFKPILREVVKVIIILMEESSETIIQALAMLNGTILLYHINPIYP